MFVHHLKSIYNEPVGYQSFNQVLTLELLATLPQLKAAQEECLA
jgi:hypothetical protein